ncbi:multifunctional 2',3'-cyclic-nucleotide 2'-phosphodiesterase/5'-nucleotidase/3'-nucleotidase, partial [Thermus scotoductus]
VTVWKQSQGDEVENGFSVARGFMDNVKERKELEGGLEWRKEILNEPKGEKPTYWAYRVPERVGV